jgi:hypothetical protein
MTLNLHTKYPSTRSYVLKLHRDAVPQRGQIAGRLENMASGSSFEFSSAAELIACLMRDALESSDAAEVSTCGPGEQL